MGLSILMIFISPALAFDSYQVCEECHVISVADWKVSMHRFAIEDPIFQMAMSQAALEGGEEVKQECLYCHSPLTRETKDYLLNDQVSKEGVNCDFCHSVSEVVYKDNKYTYKLAEDDTKFGRYEDTDAPHKTELGEQLSSAEFCAGCHQQPNKYGVMVLDTYAEWKESPYNKEGITCQGCHMTLVKDAQISTTGPIRPIFRRHTFEGGHSRMINQAAQLDVAMDIKENVVTINVDVTNSGSGHKMPTGVPSRKVILDIIVTDQNGMLLAFKNVIYERVLSDSDGNLIEKEHKMFFDAAKVKSDNRIGPKETRSETLEFDLAPDVYDLVVETILRYNYVPEIVTSPGESSELFIMELVMAEEISTFSISERPAVKPTILGVPESKGQLSDIIKNNPGILTHFGAVVGGVVFGGLSLTYVRKVLERRKRFE